MNNIKNLFKQSVSEKVLEQIDTNIESRQYIEEKLKNDEKFVPQVDFADPSQFCFYGSAEKYYEDSIKRIYNTYPYDGSFNEKQQWYNSSSYLDNFTFDNLYPRTTGYLNFNSSSYIYTDCGQQVGNVDKQQSNIIFDLDEGVTIEFWTKVTPNTPASAVVIDISNSGSANYGDPDYIRFHMHVDSSNPGFSAFFINFASGSSLYQTEWDISPQVEDWAHLAFALNQTDTQTYMNFYKDSVLDSAYSGVSVNGQSVVFGKISSGLKMVIGAMIESDVDNYGGSAGGLGEYTFSGSLDEFRFWNETRTAEQIYLNYQHEVAGGSNTDLLDTSKLGLYYKFNEGIVGSTTYDQVVLDYSGRVSNGLIVNYVPANRSTSSAMEEYNSSIVEFKDPIIYSVHSDVQSLLTEMMTSGSTYDRTNSNQIFSKFPQWMVEEDLANEDMLLNMSQVMASYFDTLHLQIKQLPRLKDVHYTEDHEHEKPFMDVALRSKGLAVPEIFGNAKVLEALSDMSIENAYPFEAKTSEVKNSIYQNLYNNLTHIFKQKGTEKAFRNIIRCFGIDDEVIKLHTYANNLDYELNNNYRIKTEKKKYIDFSNNYNGTVHNTGSIIDATGELNWTFEAEVIFPDYSSHLSDDTVTSSVSLFGCAAPTSVSDLTWSGDAWFMGCTRLGKDHRNASFWVYPVISDVEYLITSSIYQEVYSNSRWNFAVRFDGVNTNFFGYNSETLEEFEEELSSTTVDLDDLKCMYAGALRTNFTGSVDTQSNVKISSIRVWNDYLTNEEIKKHSTDLSSYGRLNPTRNS